MKAVFGALTCVLATSALAQSVDDKRCIFAAAQKLPNLPGLTVATSRIVELSKEVTGRLAREQNWRGVEITVKAAAQDATFNFVCGINGSVVLAEPLGIVR